MTSEQIADLRQWCADSDNGRGDGAEGTGVILDTPVLRQLLDEREALLPAAKEAAEGFDVIAADDSRLLALLRDAIAKAELP